MCPAASNIDFKHLILNGSGGLGMARRMEKAQ